MEHTVMRLVDRQEEMEFLTSTATLPQAQFIVLYGRRRVGKTYLLQYFCQDKPHLYYLCSKGNEHEQIKQLSVQMGEFFRDDALAINPFTSWEQLFPYLAKRAEKERIYIIIDEFPFLISSNPAIPSIFQKYWDLYLSKTKTYLVLCGSSIGMMEREVLAYQSPLYGRRTGQWKVTPLSFKNSRDFFPASTMLREQIEFYALTGGIIYYLNEFDLALSVQKNILANIARKGKILYEEGEVLVREELSDPKTYFSILDALAQGKTKQSDIADAIGMASTSLTRYLLTLQRLGFIEKANPITEKPRAKKTLYKISDHFLQFWFKFIYKYKGLIEEGNYRAFTEYLERDFNSQVSFVFEKICQEAVREANMIDSHKIGSWWSKDQEIDIVAFNNISKEMLFGECKWKDQVDARKLYQELRQKSLAVDWNNDSRKEKYVLFARSFREKWKEENLFLFDLKDLEAIFRGRG